MVPKFPNTLSDRPWGPACRLLVGLGLAVAAGEDARGLLLALALPLAPRRRGARGLAGLGGEEVGDDVVDGVDQVEDHLGLHFGGELDQVLLVVAGDQDDADAGASGGEDLLADAADR